MTFRGRRYKAHPAIVVLTSFLLVIIVGVIALKLPFSTKSGAITWVDALFTATSAVCVTGLVVVDTGSYFTSFGQSVILILIQIGGLGVMTISVALFRWIGRIISFRHRMIMQEMFAHSPREDIFNLIKNIIFFTLGVEFFGGILLTIHWARELPILDAVYMGMFHSISAFCNAGFALFPDSMMRYSNDLLFNVIICCLIVIGGIGFPVIYDLQAWLMNRRKKRVSLAVQTKTVLLTTVSLIIAGALLFAFLERQSFGETQTLSNRLLIPLFQSITCRTAGFNTVDIASLREATLALMIFLMFFGASPGSCGGGVKTTTLALVVMFTLARIKRKRRVNMFKKSVPIETVNRSLSLILVSIGIVSIVLFMLLIRAPGNQDIDGGNNFFLGYFFETVSAFGTVGLSMGITPELSIWGKGWIILTMLIGRIGVLAFSYIVIGVGTMTEGIEHAEENIMIG
ncbi:MAG: ATPase [Desulfobacterales bacterium]|nr:ATPase [Desulfobacterales bacterium]